MGVPITTKHARLPASKTSSSSISLSPSDSAALASIESSIASDAGMQAMYSSILSADPALATALADPNGTFFTNSSNFNMTTLAWDAFVANASVTTRGCFGNATVPMPLAANDTCNLGFFCPNSTNAFPPQYCHPGPECALLRAHKGTCEPQGFLEPSVCPPGSHCPAGGKKMITCPKGTFCPIGSYEPWPCAYGAICPEGSQRQITTIPLFLVVAIDVVLAIVVLIGFAISKKRKGRAKHYTTLDDLDGTGDHIELLHAPASMARSPSPSPSFKLTAPDAISTTPMPTHMRRASGRADHYDGYADDETAEMLYDAGGMEDDYHNSLDMQRFIRSMTKTVETSSIGLSFDFENLSFTTKGGKKILQDITGTMPRGSCWGVMGGSGAGKSTFLNVLMGKAHATSGSIKINGWTKDMSKYKKLIGYVPQDDIVFPELTVRENILHSARCRLPSTWRDKAIQDHVDALIACLQLTHVQHSRVGDANRPVVSGGQRKRVNIGMELASAPMAIFLDEPTSGLDATSAASIMRLLRAISRLGVTTVAIIHQPREQIFYGFDQLLLLAQGRSVYSGPTDEVQRYFEGLGFAFPQRANPADTLIDIITGDGAQYTLGSAGTRDTEVTTLIDEWTKKGVHIQHLAVDGAGGGKRGRRASNQSMGSFATPEQEESLRKTMRARGASWVAQAYYCWKRAMTQQVRNKTSFFFEIGVGGLAGVVIGLSAFSANGHLFQGIYHDSFAMLSSAVDYAGIPQMALLGGMAIGLAASAPGFWVFGEEKLMYWRETASGHSRSAYYVGKLTSTLLRIALSSLHFSVFLGVLAVPLESFGKMYAANLCYFWCIYGLASVVSMFVKREDGPLLAVLAALIIGILGGVAPPLSKVKTWHMEWLWRCSPGVWFTESYFTENVLPLEYLYNVPLASSAVGFTTGQYGLDLVMLFVIGIVYRVVAYLGLIMVHRDKQR